MDLIAAILSLSVICVLALATFWLWPKRQRKREEKKGEEVTQDEEQRRREKEERWLRLITMLKPLEESLQLHVNIALDLTEEERQHVAEVLRQLVEQGCSVLING
jgi:hypothetical protein